MFFFLISSILITAARKRLARNIIFPDQWTISVGTFFHEIIVLCKPPMGGQLVVMLKLDQYLQNT